LSAVVRIAEELLPWIDAAVKQARNEFGGQKYRNKKDVVDDAVKRLIRELKLIPPPENSPLEPSRPEVVA